MMNIKMKKLILPLLSLAALALPAEAQQAVTIPRPDPAVAEFARGVKFKVNGYQGGEEVQTNFPVLVRLSTVSPTKSTRGTRRASRSCGSTCPA